MVHIQPRLLTPEEYLELEAKANYKSEYRNGEIVPMTGGTTNHNELVLSLAATLKHPRLGIASQFCCAGLVACSHCKGWI